MACLKSHDGGRVSHRKASGRTRLLCGCDSRRGPRGWMGREGDLWKVRINTYERERERERQRERVEILKSAPPPPSSQCDRRQSRMSGPLCQWNPHRRSVVVEKAPVDRNALGRFNTPSTARTEVLSPTVDRLSIRPVTYRLAGKAP